MAASIETTAAGGVDVRRPPPRTAGLRIVAVVVVAGLAVAAGVWWWQGTGAHLQPAGNGVSAPQRPVGQPTYIAYPLDPTGGSVTIDGVHLDHPSPSVTAAFFVATGPCPIGATWAVPDTCDLRPVAGAEVEPGTTGTLIAEYVLTADGSASPGDVVVAYHDGLHRRSTRLGTAVCLSTTPFAACPLAGAP